VRLPAENRRALLVIATIAMLGALILPPAALAAPTTGSQEPRVAPPYLGYTPPGFTSSAAQAVAAAKATATMQSLHRRLHPLYVQPLIWDGRSWVVDFSYGARIVAEADLTSRARVTHVLRPHFIRNRIRGCRNEVDTARPFNTWHAFDQP